MAIVVGTSGSGNILQARQVIDMADGIALLEPKKAPFLVLSKNLPRKRKAAATKVSWMEDALNARFDAVNNAAGYAAGITAIVVDNAAYFKVGDIVKVTRTKEQMRVTAYNTGTNTLTVVRGTGTTAAAALVDNDELYIIGNASMEGDVSPEYKTTQQVEKYNYTEIIKTPFGVTNTAQHINLYGDKALNYEQFKAGIEHSKTLSSKMWFGERGRDTTGAHPLQTMGGALSFITNAYDAGGQLTESEFDQSVCEQAFMYGSEEKVMFSAGRLLSVISAWGKNKLQINDMATKKYGLSIMDYETPHGLLHLVREPLFKGSAWGGYGVILDMEKLEYRPLRDTSLETNIQPNNADKREDQYLTEMTMQIENPECHMLLYGVTS